MLSRSLLFCLLIHGTAVDIHFRSLPGSKESEADEPAMLVGDMTEQELKTGAAAYAEQAKTWGVVEEESITKATALASEATEHRAKSEVARQLKTEFSIEADKLAEHTAVEQGKATAEQMQREEIERHSTALKMQFAGQALARDAFLEAARIEEAAIKSRADKKRTKAQSLRTNINLAKEVAEGTSIPGDMRRKAKLLEYEAGKIDEELAKLVKNNAAEFEKLRLSQLTEKEQQEETHQKWVDMIERVGGKFQELDAQLKAHLELKQAEVTDKRKALKEKMKDLLKPAKRASPTPKIGASAMGADVVKLYAVQKPGNMQDPERFSSPRTLSRDSLKEALAYDQARIKVLARKEEVAMANAVGLAKQAFDAKAKALAHSTSEAESTDHMAKLLEQAALEWDRVKEVRQLRLEAEAKAEEIAKKAVEAAARR